MTWRCPFFVGVLTFSAAPHLYDPESAPEPSVQRCRAFRPGCDGPVRCTLRASQVAACYASGLPRTLWVRSNPVQAHVVSKLSLIVEDLWLTLPKFVNALTI